MGTTQTINGTFHADGTCAALINIQSSISGSLANISHPPAAVNISYVVLKDINATGGATFTAANSNDLGNNTGWTFSSPGSQNLYWVGNGGNWNDGNHWSHSSGGTAAGCSPGPADNVFFDANSFSAAAQTVSINLLTAFCRNITWTAVTNNPTLAGPSANLLKIYGSLTLATGMNMTFSGPVNFEATTTGQTITMAGKHFSENVSFNGIGGEWTLQDAFTTSRTIMLNNGTLTSNDQTVNAGQFQSTSGNSRTLNMGSSVFNIGTIGIPWYIDGDYPPVSMTLNSGTSVINISGDEFRGGAMHTYYDVNFTNALLSQAYLLGSYGENHFHNVVFAAKAYITHPSVFNNLTFLADGTLEADNIFNDLNFTAGHTYIIWKNKIQTINDHWRIQGSCTNYIVLQTDDAGSFATFTKPTGSVQGYNIHIRDIHCTGGANFIAYNSVDLGGNTGWNFLLLPPLFSPGLISGPSQVCIGATGVIYHISQVQGAISYQWTVPQGATITSGQGDTLIVVDFGTASSGDITVQSFNGCNPGTSSSTFTVVLESPLIPTVTLTASPSGAICPATAVTFTAVAANTGSGSVIYDFKINGNSVQNSNSGTYTTTALLNGDDVICGISVTGGTCNLSSTAVSNNIIITINACDPVVTDSSCRLDIKTRIFPNPTGDILTINKNPTLCRVTMNLYDRMGHLLMKNKMINDGPNDIKLSALSSGIYYYKLISNNNILLSGKIIKL